MFESIFDGEASEEEDGECSSPSPDVAHQPLTPPQGKDFQDWLAHRKAAWRQRQYRSKSTAAVSPIQIPPAAKKSTPKKSNPKKSASSPNRPSRQRATPVVFESSMKGERAILRDEGALLNSLAGYRTATPTSMTTLSPPTPPSSPFDVTKCPFVLPRHPSVPESCLPFLGNQYSFKYRDAFYPVLVFHPGCLEESNQGESVRVAKRRPATSLTSPSSRVSLRSPPRTVPAANTARCCRCRFLVAVTFSSRSIQALAAEERER